MRLLKAVRGALVVLLLTMLTTAISAAPTDRQLVSQAVIPASLHEVWTAFTTSSGAQSFFAPKANIELRLQGPYEVFFNPADERQGTKGLKILSFAPEHMLSMQWNAPPELPVAREAGMWVVIELNAIDQKSTAVRITHLGWQDGPGWSAAYPHFEQGWRELLARLTRRFQSGPIDWAAEAMMWQK